ncbi:MAG: hypothetical protein LBC07_05060 [Elusimicrobiota bacterium]|jgi:hypothetical protein|nr:hypothetical protein [Elusimicrobiota bacterium]
MKRLFCIVLVLFFFSAAHALDIFMNNVSLQVPDDWIARQIPQNSPGVVVIAGTPTGRSDIFYTEQIVSNPAPIPLAGPDGLIDYQTAVVIFGEGILLNPVLNIFKMSADGKSVNDFKVAETMSMRVKTGGKILETKDNYFIAQYQDGMTDKTRLEYLYINNNVLYIVLFECSKNKFSTYRKVFEDINNSIKFQENK